MDESNGSTRPTPTAAGVGRSAAARLRPSYLVGIVNYRTYEDLDEALRSVKSQSLAPERVFVVDADGDPEQRSSVAARHPEACFEPRPNRGFAAGANTLLSLAGETDADYLLLLNPDIQLDPYFAERLSSAMTASPQAALGSGKLLRPDSATIDSAGIVMPANRRPRDRGSEEPDLGQFDAPEFVFGASGAALMIRLAAVDDLAIEGEVFDEDFFLYHEDTDLSWRANLLGWRVLYVPDAQAIHQRRWRVDGRFDIDVEVRRHSFKNHYLQIAKNERIGDLLRGLPVLLAWEAARLGFLILRDPGLLPAYGSALRHLPAALRKRKLVQQRARGSLPAGLLSSRGA